MAEHSAREQALASLRRLFRGQLSDEAGLESLARDSGIFRLVPLAALRPRSENDIRAVIRVAREHKIPLVVRAGGSNTGGAAVTDGILLLMGPPEPPRPGSGQQHADTGRDVHPFAGVRVIPNESRVVCGPALRHDHLQKTLARHGLWLPCDPSSGPLSYVGGNVNTRASGPHALAHGAFNRYVREVRIILADGSVLDTRDPGSAPQTLIGGLSSLARRLHDDTPTRSRLEARRDFKWASGYELLALIDHADDPLRAVPRLVTGSVGTLGVLTEVELAVARTPESRAALLLRFEAASDACRAAYELRDGASAVEIVSREALRLIREQTDILGDDPASEALLIVEYAGSAEAVARSVRSSARRMEGEYRLSAHPETALSEDRINEIWRARKALLPVIRRLAGTAGAPYSVVNDVGVPPGRLAELLEGAEAIFAQRGIVAPIYGHAGSGNLHLRPLFRPGDANGVLEVANEIYALVTRLGGTITAEHGMGRLRTPFLELEWGERIVGLMREVKQLFDPYDTFNPGVMTPAPGWDIARNGWPLAPDLETLPGPW